MTTGAMSKLKQNSGGEKTTLFQKADKGMMYLVERGVNAWNWTTGYTKAELANNFITAAAVSVPVGLVICTPSYPLIYLTSPN